MSNYMFSKINKNLIKGGDFLGTVITGLSNLSRLGL